MYSTLILNRKYDLVKGSNALSHNSSELKQAISIALLGFWILKRAQSSPKDGSYALEAVHKMNKWENAH